MRPFVTLAEAEKALNAICSISRSHKIFFLWRLISKDLGDDFLIELAIKATLISLSHLIRKTYPELPNLV